MKKVLFCASRASHIINFHQPYIDYYKSMGFKVDVAAEGKLALKGVDSKYDMEFHKSILSFKNIKTIFKLSNIIKENNYDLIISNATLAGVICRAAFIFSGVRQTKLVHICHGYLFNDNNNLKSIIYRYCEKLTSSPINNLLIMNKADYNIAKKYKLAKKISFINGMGLDTNKFLTISNQEVKNFKDKYGINKSDFVFLCVGEFSKRKNQELVLQAFKNAFYDDYNVKLLFAGEGELLEHCKMRSNELNLKSRVVFLGNVEKINSLYRIVDVVVSASHIEGMPFNIMESLYCNVPIVASNVKGHYDLIKDNFNGLLFKDNDLGCLSYAMKTIFYDKAKYMNLKKQSYLPRKYYLLEASNVIIDYYNKATNTQEVLKDD